ncbi:hypothetical protein T492DRAFT_984358 [Pavlovales sp. CCMP2436]|nr:hypothetical protein T492DRAFT_984358 [Pavlovales sp. CCMP2436]
MFFSSAFWVFIGQRLGLGPLPLHREKSPPNRSRGTLKEVFFDGAGASTSAPGEARSAHS